MTAEASQLLQREVQSRLGRRVLVEWVVSRGTVLALVMTASSFRMVEVGRLTDLERDRDRALAWLDRAAIEGGASADAARHTLGSIDARLLGPLGLPSGADVVVVPVDGLHGMPWSGLPSFAAGSVTVAPSARLWMHADRRSSAAVRTVGLLIGRDLADADVERAAVESHHADPIVAWGEGATAGSARSMLAGLDLVHVAAHGSFRSDQPLLSTLLLEDGASALHQIVPERLATRLVVLSSCEGGAQGVEPGSEVLGLSAVLLARGAASVLAPLTIVRERECVDFVAEVHAALAGGQTAGAAVAGVRRRWLAAGDLGRWAVAASFTVFGSGEVGLARP